VPDADALRRTLSHIDGRGYKAYRDIRGSWKFDTVCLYVDHVQGDPYAAPSRVRVRVPMQRAALPRELFGSRVSRGAWATRSVGSPDRGAAAARAVS
jgi:hypothetical protein